MPSLPAARCRWAPRPRPRNWSTGEQSTLPLAFLWRFRKPRGALEEPAVERLHWDAATIAERLPRIAHDAVMAGDEGLERWLSAVLTFGFCLVEGVPATPADSAALARRIGYLRTTIFGDFRDFTADLAKADTAYTAGAQAAYRRHLRARCAGAAALPLP